MWPRNVLVMNTVYSGLQPTHDTGEEIVAGSYAEATEASALLHAQLDDGNEDNEDAGSSNQEDRPLLTTSETR